MKTLKTLFAVLLIASISNIASAKQGGLLGKAKEAAAKKDAGKSPAKEVKKKGGKGGDKMAVKGTGVPQNSTEKAPATATPSTEIKK
jgi:hypothetical protein